MKCIKVNLPWELENANIEIFADLHIGSKKCNYQVIMERIKKVKESENTYCVILGDICNNSTRTSVGDVYEEELSPMQQINKAVSMFEPIKDKIIGITSGNHERRSYKADGIDLGYMFAKELGREAYYDYCACLLLVRVGTSSAHRVKAKTQYARQVTYSVYLTHGDGNGGRTVGGKVNGLQRRGQIVDADIIITGHTHAPITFRDSAFRIDYANNKVIQFEQLFVNASATLNYEEYAELYGMRPSSIISPVIHLSGKEKFAYCTM